MFSDRPLNRVIRGALSRSGGPSATDNCVVSKPYLCQRDQCPFRDRSVTARYSEGPLFRKFFKWRGGSVPITKIPAHSIK